MPLDWGAIDAACNGYRMKLSVEEQAVAVRRMLDEGKYAVALIAHYAGCTERQVHRLTEGQLRRSA
jgi:hypothetical protein